MGGLASFVFGAVNAFDALFGGYQFVEAFAYAGRKSFIEGAQLACEQGAEYCLWRSANGHIIMQHVCSNDVFKDL